MRRIDEQYLKTPCYGSRKMAEVLGIDRKRAQRLMRLMGLEAIYPKPRLSQNDDGASDLPVFAAECGDRAAQPGVVQRHHLRADAAGLDVLDGGHGLVQPLRAVVAVVEHASTGCFAWRRWRKRWAAARRRSSTPTRACSTRPRRSPSRLESAGVAISMDGRGRWMDNVFVERLWRTVKYEYIYLHDYATPRALQAGLAELLSGSTTRSGFMRPWITARRRRCTRGGVSSRRACVVEINVIFLETNLENQHVLIVGERLCGRARPLEWVSRAASPLHLRNRNQWSRQPGPPQ